MGTAFLATASSTVTDISARTIVGTALALIVLLVMFSFFRQYPRVRYIIFILIVIFILTATSILFTTALTHVRSLTADLPWIGRFS